MKLARSLYHFLGGIYFALILFATVALFVIAGTFIESVTQSHRYAAFFTYDNPLFAALLWGFFINIFFSATRRWPFQWKHLPFLITHCGLLMILAGVLAKHYYGLQGSMAIAEGTGSQEIVQTNTYAISVDKKNGPSIKYPLKKNPDGSFAREIKINDESLSIRLAAFYPHSTEHLASWVKGSHATISGLRPMPLYEVTNEERELPVAGRARFHQSEAQIWDLYALKTSDIEKTLAQLFSQNARLIVKNRISQEVTGNFPLEIAFQAPVKLKDGTPLKAGLSLEFSSVEGFQNPTITASIGNRNQMTIPLSGRNALLNLETAAPFGSLPLSLDIVRNPLIAIIEDVFEDIYLIAFDPHGNVWSKSFLKGSLDSLVAYDDGFSGYTTRADLPFKAYAAGRQEREDALGYQLTVQFRQAIADGAELSPPLKLLQQACHLAQADFPDCATTFLMHWNACHDWLYPESILLPNTLKTVFSKINWENAPVHVKRACNFVRRLFAQIGPELKQGGELLSVLKKNNWPLLDALKTEALRNKIADRKHVEFTLLTWQLFAASESLPDASSAMQESKTTPEIQATLLSAYLRAYEIHLSNILAAPTQQEMEGRHPPSDEDLSALQVTLETPVVSIQKTSQPSKKLEDNFPKITLHVSEGQRAQKISLVYEPTGSGLKWPVLDGEYLMRFQPQFKELPYRIRLRQGRQINYANSSQPYSFESDLIITDLRTNTRVEKTISMNKVHETWDGYRFYLSSIAPPHETGVKHVQIVVNYDPAKYWLTYPGAIILSCGILMLFMMRPYRRPKQ